MRLRRLILLSLLTCSVGYASIPVYAADTAIPVSVSAVQTSIADFSYDSELSLLKITPKRDGTTYYSYKTGGSADTVAYPVYTKDIVYIFNADGSLAETKTGQAGQAIFSDDPSTWIDVSKTTPRVLPDSEYYQYFRQGDGDLVLPYSEEGDGTFYLPLETKPTYITVYAVNIDSTGNVSEVSSADFVYGGVSSDQSSDVTASLTSVSKSSTSETVRITGSYKDGMDYVQLRSQFYKFNGDSVDIELTTNGEKRFRVYGKGNVMPVILVHTVDGIVEEQSGGGTSLADVVDNDAPVITTDAVPTEKRNTRLPFKVYTNEKCTISCNGVSSTDATEFLMTIAGNGEYLITATDTAGNYSEKRVVFDCFDGVILGEEYTLDKETLWGKTKDGVPKTGDSTWLFVLIPVSILSGIGSLVMIKRRRKQK